MCTHLVAAGNMVETLFYSDLITKQWGTVHNLQSLADRSSLHNPLSDRIRPPLENLEVTRLTDTWSLLKAKPKTQENGTYQTISLVSFNLANSCPLPSAALDLLVLVPSRRFGEAVADIHLGC